MSRILWIITCLCGLTLSFVPSLGQGQEQLSSDVAVSDAAVSDAAVTEEPSEPDQDQNQGQNQDQSDAESPVSEVTEPPVQSSGTNTDTELPSSEDVSPTEATQDTAVVEETIVEDANDVTKSGLLSDEQILAERQGVDHQYSGIHPHEKEDQAYFFLGGFYRHSFLPKALLELFLDKASSVNGPQFGVEFIYRRNNFELGFSGYYEDFSMAGVFLGKSKPITDIEFVNSSVKTGMIGVDLRWGVMFNDFIGLQYGLGFGVGAVFGDITRSEAYPSNGPNAVDGYASCAAVGTADPNNAIDTTRHAGLVNASDWCESGGQYGAVESKWSGGGTVPNVWFRLAPQMSLRIKPMQQIVLRIDGGFDLFSGAFVGGALLIGL